MPATRLSCAWSLLLLLTLPSPLSSSFVPFARVSESKPFLLEPPLPPVSATARVAHAHASIEWANLHGSAFGLAVAEAFAKQPGVFVIVMEDPRLVQKVEAEIRFYQHEPIPLYHFPDWECLPYDNFSPHSEIISTRLRLLASLPTLSRGIVLLQATNLQQRVPPREYVFGHTFSLRCGQNIDLGALRQRLVDANYTAVAQVIAPGEFAVRGGLVDVYPMGAQSPFRLDLLDDEIESIRLFDPDSQRSSTAVDDIELLPAREFPLTEAGIRHFRAAFRQYFDGDPRQQLIYNEVSRGLAPAGAEFFFPLFFDATATLFDYLPESTIFFTTPSLAAQVALNWAEIRDRYTNINCDPRRQLLAPEKLYLEPDSFTAAIAAYPTIQWHHAPAAAKGWSANNRPSQQFPVDTTREAQESPYHALLQHLTTTQNRTLLVAETTGRREALYGVLHAHGHHPVESADFHTFVANDDSNNDCRLGLCIGVIERGFHSPAHGLEIICEGQLYGEKVYQRRRRKQAAVDPEALIRSLAELKVGDPVVHVEHGIGRYIGLEVLAVDGEVNEFLTIAYQNDDKLYLPVLAIHLISRFVGGQQDNAPLHRLGAGQWQKAKRRASEKAYDVATELLETDALRQARDGAVFDVVEAPYQRFISRFAFEETPDQQEVIDQVIADLRAPKPMDRLVCGDVGFGKTEVALRAAFIVANGGHQVAILTPTTLLAAQHHQLFTDRFADWPIRVEVLSRFNTPKQTTAIVADLAGNRVQIIIGTHRLLQKDIRFATLGLVIIDEEHRFGVRQKEQFKRLRSEVDILTLTATPIPRTLNLSMSGLRDISMISTPPANRVSIKTLVREWDRGLIREACLREIRRGGQVYFLHNQVKSIIRVADELAELVDEATVNIGHGQMAEMQLERVMQDFYHQRFNILVCSTIIESGIDIPTANTIIINRADRFGLAQLHQLRGRVGRSHHQAFAYLLIPGRNQISADAVKRLDAIAAMDALGAGFTLASHDLEIRGAGQLLGETQSGLIDDVGFFLYQEYLRAAIASIKDGGVPATTPAMLETQTTLELQVPALLSVDYLANSHARLILYKRIANAESSEALQELQIETIDRFGLLPPDGKNLFRQTDQRLRAHALGIRNIELSDRGGRIEFYPHTAVSPEQILTLIAEQPQEYRLGGDYRLTIAAELPSPMARMDKVDAILALLADASHAGQ